MSKIKKKPIAVAALIVAVLLANIYILFYYHRLPTDIPTVLSFNFMSDSAMDIQLFFSDNDVFSEQKSSTVSYNDVNNEKLINFVVPTDTQYIRLDFGDSAASFAISDMALSAGNLRFDIENASLLSPVFTNSVTALYEQDGKISIVTDNNDPFIAFSIGDKLANTLSTATAMMQRKNLAWSIVLCLCLDIAVVFLLMNINTVFSVAGYIYREWSMFWILMKNDFQARFAGSYFGIFWAFVQPVIMMVLYWFVFQVGLRAGNVSAYPFILFLMSGLIPWMYFSEALSSSTNVLSEYSYLVKKVIFNIEILPVIKVASSIFIHLFFVAVIIIMCAFYGYAPDLYTLQLVYYILCMIFLTMGLAYVFSAVTAFFKDMSQIVNILLTIGVWLTPIMWNPDGVLSDTLTQIFRLNPMYYIVDGFRDSLLNKVWFWDKPGWTCYFWIFSIVVYVGGNKIFNKLRVHFADVL